MLTERFDAALAYASALHREQRRKGSSVPYVAHLLATAALVLEAGGSEEEAMAALLHDAAEDQGGEATLQAIRDRFGEAVAQIVRGCSDSITDQGGEKAPWRERKERYLAHLAHASPSLVLVSAADKLHNLRSIVSDYREMGESLWERFNGGREGTIWYYESLTRRLLDTGLHPRITGELARTLEELRRVMASDRE